MYFSINWFGANEPGLLLQSVVWSGVGTIDCNGCNPPLNRVEEVEVANCKQNSNMEI